MELSRQRRRSSLLEGTTHVCEHCAGTGRVRSIESSALGALRAVEMEALKGAGEVTLRAPRAVALYILNEKRAHLARLHADQGVFVAVVVDEALPHAEFVIERTSDQARPSDIPSARKPLEPYVPADDDLDAFDDEARLVPRRLVPRRCEARHPGEGPEEPGRHGCRNSSGSSRVIARNDDAAHPRRLQSFDERRRPRAERVVQHHQPDGDAVVRQRVVRLQRTC